MSAISIDAVLLVTNEVVAITSAMRKNAQWANSGMAAILGASPHGQHDNLASRLRPRNHGSTVCILALSSPQF